MPLKDPFSSPLPSSCLAEAGLPVNDPDLFAAQFPSPTDDGHKYDRGHALILGGGLEGVGACRLSAQAALRIGAGLVTLAVASEALAVQATHEPAAVMVRRFDGADDLARLARHPIDAIAVGPALGLDEHTRSKVESAIWLNKPIVLDADALTSFTGATDTLAALLKQRQQPAVLTPHEGEFFRLFEFDRSESRLERAQRAARLIGAVIVLKGQRTLIVAPDGQAAININASPYLATAGSGDVLTGMIAGLLAQGMSGFTAACAAVWLHGKAGSKLGPGLIADDLPHMLPILLAERAQW